MADIQLFRPQRLTDNPDGGGLATATPIVDGQVNNLFDDISRIDRVNGELSLRKAFVIAATANTELFSDVHVTVQAPPLDPRVSAVLFRTPGWADDRDDAKAAVERYLDESVLSRMVPYDRQLQGQRTVLVFQRAEAALPEIGEVYVLKNDTSGATEFIRLQDVDHVVETFSDDKGDFKARVITLTISQPLSQEFQGSQPNRYFSVAANKAVMRKTVASDAARYKGVVALAQDAAVGDLSVRVESIFAQLVPSATSETPVVDASPVGARGVFAAATATHLLSINPGLVFAFGDRYLPTAITPGSLFLTGGNLSADDGRGSLVPSDSQLRTGSTIRYEEGVVRAGTNNISGTSFFNYLPAAVVEKSGLSTQIPVQAANRGYVYTTTLRPAPAPGSTIVSFRAQGRWYTIEDDGTGAIVGDPGIGTGLVNYVTGSVQVTLGALPDVGSSIIFAFGSAGEYQIRTGDATIEAPSIRRTVPAGNIERGSLSVTWLAGGVAKTATDNGAGVITGDATGRVIYSTGEYVLKPTLLPDPNTTYTASYTAGATDVETFNPTASGGTISLTASHTPIRPGSVRIEYSGTAYGYNKTYARTRVLRDNGGGQLYDELGNLVTGSVVNYTTGVATFDPNFNAYLPSATLNNFPLPIPSRAVSAESGHYEAVPRDSFAPYAMDAVAKVVPWVNGTTTLMRYKRDSVVDTGSTDVAPAQPLTIDLLPTTQNAVVPGGVMFVLGGKTYIDRDGTLYHTVLQDTGAATAAGTIDYTNGLVSITNWTGGGAPTLAMKALLTEVAPMPLGTVHGRTPGSPLRPGSFYVRAVRYRDGALIDATSDNSGNLDTPAMHGYIDALTGVYSIAFGAYVLDSSLTSGDKAEPWYSAANVDADGYIWRPDEIIPGTLRFNCVVQTALPHDPEIIKVNPVRLPTDGRVPVIRSGDTLVISDTLPYTVANPVVAGSTTTLPRTALASVAVYDANGLGVDPSLYVANLAAGTLLWDTPLDLSAYAQPLVALHTIEDMALCLDAQINGEVQLASALTHAFTAGHSLVSSALILGDAQSRYEHMFAQATWTNVWDDNRIGAAPAGGAQYNDALYPVEVKNTNAITQRWRISFTSAIAFQVVGESLGVIASGTTAADVAPINPATGQPYFTLRAAGFGAGWATGNQLRFNTIAAGAPVWVARTVLSGPPTELEDRVRLELRWDKD